MQQAIVARYRPEWRIVCAARRARARRVFTGVHLKPNVGRISACAKAPVLGGGSVRVMAPCSPYRELIADFAPAARVFVPESDGAPVARRVAKRLRGKYPHR